MHTKPMHDSEGKFSEAADEMRHCKKCGKQTNHECNEWDSSCGGYTDYRFTCLDCGTQHWVDGCDS
jgi:hypothetical protein